jgi:hypothetical protein
MITPLFQLDSAFDHSLLEPVQPVINGVHFLFHYYLWPGRITILLFPPTCVLRGVCLNPGQRSPFLPTKPLVLLQYIMGK